MKKDKVFCFTVDDNIRVLKELTSGTYESIFDHPYLGVYRRLHEKYDLKVQLNLFYEMEGFDLSQMTDRYRGEWEKNADWLKLSFHSRLENTWPYKESGYKEVFEDCRNVHREILRFAGAASLGKTTTVHFCAATNEGISALKDNGVQGLLGLYGTEEKPRSSYQNTPSEAALMRDGQIVRSDGVAYAEIDIVLNCFPEKEILRQLNARKDRGFVKVMIHEQYFYPDYVRYQPEFEQKLDATFDFLTQNGFGSIFFENML
jgi:hypothetical protein